MEEIIAAKPADDPTLQAMTICCREMQKRKDTLMVIFLFLKIPYMFKVLPYITLSCYPICLKFYMCKEWQAISLMFFCMAFQQRVDS